MSAALAAQHSDGMSKHSHTARRRVRAWSSADGTLLWERSAGEARHMLVLPEADANTANRLALMLEGSIQVSCSFTAPLTAATA